MPVNVVFRGSHVKAAEGMEYVDVDCRGLEPQGHLCALGGADPHQGMTRRSRCYCTGAGASAIKGTLDPPGYVRPAPPSLLA